MQLYFSWVGVYKKDGPQWTIQWEILTCLAATSPRFLHAPIADGEMFSNHQAAGFRNTRLGISEKLERQMFKSRFAGQGWVQTKFPESSCSPLAILIALSNTFTFIQSREMTKHLQIVAGRSSNFHTFASEFGAECSRDSQILMDFL